MLRSRDQGWSDDRTTHGTFRGSFSWLEASIFIEDDSYEGNARREPLEGLLLSGGVASRMPRYLEEHMEGRLGTSPPPLFLVGSSLQMMMRIIRRHGYKCRLNRWTNEEDGDGNGSGNEDKKITWPLQRNRVAASTSTCEEYVVEWTVDGGCVQQGAKSKEPNQDGAEEELSDNGAGKGEGFVQALQSGDRIGIWARAKVCILRLIASIVADMCISILDGRISSSLQRLQSITHFEVHRLLVIPRFEIEIILLWLLQPVYLSIHPLLDQPICRSGSNIFILHHATLQNT